MHASLPALLAAALAAPLAPLPPQPPDVSWPTRDWPVAAAPPALSRAVGAAFAEPDPERPIRAHAVLVVHRGRVVAEQYGPGIRADTALPGWSVAKTATTLLAGVLVGAGKLDLRGPTRVPGWAAPDPRAAVTLEHLLRMSSGLAWREDYYNPLASEVLTMLFGSGRHDMAAFAEARPLAAPPGSLFAYSCGSTLVVSKEIRRALGDDARYRAFPREALFDRLGMRSAVFEADGAGTFVGSSYLVATARDFARLGLLMLRDGVWEGGRVLPEGWIDFMRTPAPAHRDAHYGAGVWLRPSPSAAEPMSELPADAFWASGKDGQFVVVVPSRDLVVVRLGTTPLDGRFDVAHFVGGLAAAAP